LFPSPGLLPSRHNNHNAGRHGEAFSIRGNAGIRQSRASPDDRATAVDSSALLNVVVLDLPWFFLFPSILIAARISTTAAYRAISPGLSLSD
jgi:hypothetical protein